TFALSVSSSARGSSVATRSPSFFSQRSRTASVTDSPREGTSMFVGILVNCDLKLECNHCGAGFPAFPEPGRRACHPQNCRLESLHHKENRKSQILSSSI